MSKIGKIVMVRPNEKPEVKEIEFTLETMQGLVEGWIETAYGYFDDEDLILVCNEEGKINGMPRNRGILDTDGEYMDIIYGPFFICSYDDEDLVGLTDAQVETAIHLFA